MIFKPAAHKALRRRDRPRPRRRPRPRKGGKGRSSFDFTDRGGGFSSRRGLSDFVPAGLDDRSQGNLLPGTGPIKIPSRRARSDPYPGLTNRPGHWHAYQTQSYRPYGTSPLIENLPGNKLPGYAHSGPPGRRGPSASRPADAGAIPTWRNTPLLHYSITPRGRIRGRRRGRERSAW